MKLHGYSDEGKPIKQVVSRELAEVTLEASSEELRAMASFLLSVAGQTEKLGSKFGHAHLSDALPQFESSPHFVAFNLPRRSGNT